MIGEGQAFDGLGVINGEARENQDAGDRNISYDQLNKAIFKELIQNTGIVGSVISEKAYNTAGAFLQDVPTNKFRNNKIILNAPSSHDADYMFYRYYGQHFLY